MASSMDMPRTATNVITSVSSVMVLLYVMGHDPLTAIGGDLSIVVGTLVALSGGWDLAEQFDLV